MNLTLYSGDRSSPMKYRVGYLEPVMNDEVHEVLGGKFELQFQYPITGRLANEIRLGRCVTARPNLLAEPQPFVIYRRTKSINGWITVYARHYSWALRQTVCRSFSASSAESAVSELMLKTVTDHLFRVYTDMDVEGELIHLLPVSAGVLMGTGEGSICSVYGGEWEYDGDKVTLTARRGSDRGVCITYGVNMTNFLSDTQIQQPLDGIYAYCLSEYGLVSARQLVMAEEGASTIGAYVEARDYSAQMERDDLFLVESDEERLTILAREELATVATSDGEDVSFSVSFADPNLMLSNAAGGDPNGIAIGDTIFVYPRGIDTGSRLRVSEIRYQPSTGRYKSLTLGLRAKTILDTIRKK